MIIVPTEKRFDWQQAPIMLIAIVLVNVLVFVIYQSRDNEKAFRAITPFIASGYVEKEWPIYERYLEKNKQRETLTEVRRFHRDDEFAGIAQYMLLDTGYYQYVLRTARNEFSYEEHQLWQTKRAAIQDSFNAISSIAYGLKSTDVSLTTLLTHQFLHGGLGHIVGNMIFLIVFGFAVEAAIGHWRFLGFYLVGGIFAGLAQVVTTLGSDAPLIGASGAISGVMAMYLAVFRLRKIEFFYWIFFFVGYFRAPALLILPFYIGKEIYQYYTMDGSNVAFMAHAGGFIAGGILIGLAVFWNRDILNDEYIEQDQTYSAREKALAEIYKAIETLRFEFASKQISQLIEKEGVTFELALLHFNVQKIRKDKDYVATFRRLMSMKNLAAGELRILNKHWLTEQHAPNIVSLDDQLSLAFQFTGIKDLSAAENILDNLHQKQHRPADLILLANKLATRFSEKHDHAKSMRYQELAQRLTQEGHHGVL